MQHEQRRVPVTALAYWNEDVILAGAGGSLVAYNTNTKSAQTAARVFDGQAIHGIVAGSTDGHLFVWGGCLTGQVAVQTNPDGSLRFGKSKTNRASDWILDAALSPRTQDGSGSVGLITAHNALVLDSMDGTSDHNLEEVVPGSNCILYCAHISWLSPSQCLIASGTAFGDIVVWSCHTSDTSGRLSTKHQTHYTFSAHEGSVFGVQISSAAVAAALGHRTHVLVSCSDDRTVRLWDISDLSATSAALVEVPRNTGFGSRSKDELNAPPCLAYTMGHISRIWHVRFAMSEAAHGAGETAPTTVSLLSFGEDATLITWAVDLGNNAGPGSIYSLLQLSAHKAHDGKNIWSLAIGPAQRIATGAADGSLAFRSFSSISASQGQREVDIRCLNQSRDNGVFRSYGFVCSKEALAITDEGKAVLIILHDKRAVAAKEVQTSQVSLRGYSTMACVPDMAFFAGSDGFVYSHCRATGATEVVVKTSRKVADLFAQPSHCKTISVLVTNVGSNTAMLITVSEDGTAEHALQPLLLPAAFVVTSFARMEGEDQNVVIIGSRNGGIAAYNLTTPGGNEKVIPHEFLRAAVHGNETVTSLSLEDTQDAGVCTSTLFSTGRDGKYAAHRITTKPFIALTTIHQLLLPFGPNIEGCGFPYQRTLWTWGFRGKQFVVYDVSHQREIMNVECGGVHRTWVFQPDVSGGTFMWTKASKLYYERQTELPFESIDSGGHGREIKSVAISRLGLIATGAEDTNIKLSLPHEAGSWRCLHTLQKHVTGIQHLQWSRNGRYLFSSGGFEEFFAWKINYDVPLLGVGVICDSSHPNSAKSDLRIMSFDIREEDQQATADGDPAAFAITMIYSDSSIKLWSYRSQLWTLLAAGDYLTSCLTQCLYPNQDQPNKLITASTDGHLATWEIDQSSQNIQWTSRHKLHHNAILALVSHRLPNNDITFLISGGDDNAIGICALTDSGFSSSLVVPRAHAAAVTALAVVRSRGNITWFVSASIDQRLKLWKLEFDTAKAGVDALSLKLVKNVFTAVADVSSMDLVPFERVDTGVLVCGVGMELWRIDQLSTNA